MPWFRHRWQGQGRTAWHRLAAGFAGNGAARRDWLRPSGFENPGSPIPRNYDIQLLLVGSEEYYGLPATQQRGKAFAASMIGGLNVPRPVKPDETVASSWRYLTQAEAVIGLGISLRAGVSVGELMDFALGWVGVDLFRDDLHKRSARSMVRNVSVEEEKDLEEDTDQGRK